MVNICLICGHETDYVLKCFKCQNLGSLVDEKLFRKKINLVLSDPRFYGSENEAKNVVKEMLKMEIKID